MLQEQEGEIEQIIDHRVTDSEYPQYELLVEWKAGKPSWEPFQQLFKDVSQLVTDYFRTTNVSINDVMDCERRAEQTKRQNERFNSRGTRGSGFRGRGFNSGPNSRGGRGQSNMYGRGVPHDQVERGGHFRQNGNQSNQGNYQQQQEEFDPKKFRLMMRSRAADRKIQQWEAQNSLLKQAKIESPENVVQTQEQNLTKSDDVDMEDPLALLQQANKAQSIWGISPKQQETPKPIQNNKTNIWGASNSQQTQNSTSSIQDFYRQQKNNERQMRMQKLLELEKIQKAKIERQEFVTKVLDQPLKDYSKSEVGIMITMDYQKSINEINQIQSAQGQQLSSGPIQVIYADKDDGQTINECQDEIYSYAILNGDLQSNQICKIASSQLKQKAHKISVLDYYEKMYCQSLN
ncbi:UNKNOWN [Stylonychia lemnae]|uniref:Chromo domain-containing protein n=1 Tax=Stylonychia lemnae TaxID=5949 RepID=A0A078ARP0_STYLE|nr:UNKNOWN [Stylonychia lemnae]|eukprot:CDW83518.1 UNKNOWN [Stylonychia lemnae]